MPYRLPLLSMIKEPSGSNPAYSLNEASLVIVPLPLASSNTVPVHSTFPRCCAVEIAAGVHDQTGIRICPVGAVERSQRGDRATAAGQLEHRAVASAPPADAVPYRLPLLSMIKVARGFSPLVALNDASAVIVPLPLASSNTVPSPRAPPADAVPYRLPLLSMIRPARGVAPLVPLNEASVVIVPLPWASSNTVPSAWAPPQTLYRTSCRRCP